MNGAGPVDNRLEIVPHGPDVEAPESVVRSEFNHQDGHWKAQQRVDATHTTCRRFAAHAGVIHAQGDLAGIEQSLDHRGVRLGFGHAEPGCQAGTKEKHNGTGILRRSLGTGTLTHIWAYGYTALLACVARQSRCANERT